MTTKDPTYKELEKISTEIKNTRKRYDKLIHLSKDLEDAYNSLNAEFSENKK